MCPRGVEGYDPNETIRCVVYEDGKKVDILRDDDVMDDVIDEDEDNPEGEEGERYGVDIEHQLAAASSSQMHQNNGVQEQSQDQSRVGDYELVNYDQEPGRT